MSCLPQHLPPTAVKVAPEALLAAAQPDAKSHERFREALAGYFGRETHACMLASSGRTALYWLLEGLKSHLPARNEVVMPAYTCPSLARVVLDLALEPVFADLSAQTMTYETEALEAALGRRTLAVLVVHPFGIPLPVGEVLEQAHAVGAVVIDDAAQAMGAHWNGKPVGTEGDFGLFSLGPGKPLSTAGGGVVIANDAEYQALLKGWWAGKPMAGQGIAALAWLRQVALQIAFQPSGWWAATKLGLHRVGQEETSWGYRLLGLSSTQASMGLQLIPQLDEINRRRRDRAEAILSDSGAWQQVRPLAVSPQAEPIFLRLPLMADSKTQREALFNDLWAAGIGVGRMYEKTMLELFPGRKLVGNGAGAERIARCLFTLPTHDYVQVQDIERMQALLV